MTCEALPGTAVTRCLGTSPTSFFVYYCSLSLSFCLSSPSLFLSLSFIFFHLSFSLSLSLLSLSSLSISLYLSLISLSSLSLSHLSFISLSLSHLSFIYLSHIYLRHVCSTYRMDRKKVKNRHSLALEGLGCPPPFFRSKALGGEFALPQLPGLPVPCKALPVWCWRSKAVPPRPPVSKRSSLSAGLWKRKAGTQRYFNGSMARERWL